MKNAFFTLLVVFIFISSCQKERNPDHFSLSEVSKSKLLYLSNQRNSDAIRQTYSLLTSFEKYAYWKRHFQLIKLDKSIAAVDFQRNLISELENAISPSVFVHDSRENSIFMAYIFPAWYAKAQKYFTDEQLYEVLIENRNNKVTTPLVSYASAGSFDEYIPDPTVSCFCHTGNTGFSCRKVTVGSSTTIENGMCESPNSHPCTSSSNGCGWLWMQSCNGAHCNFG